MRICDSVFNSRWLEIPAALGLLSLGLPLPPTPKRDCLDSTSASGLSLSGCLGEAGDPSTIPFLLSIVVLLFKIFNFGVVTSEKRSLAYLLDVLMLTGSLLIYLFAASVSMLS